MKIHNTYTVYKGFPRATEVSCSRAFWASWLSMACGLGIFFGILFWGYPDGICLLLASIGGLLYLVFGYDKVTQKKIKKAMARDINDREEERLLKAKAIADRFKCDNIKLLDSQATGTCMICFGKNQSVTLCDITQDKITRHLYVCGCCINKFKAEETSK